MSQAATRPPRTQRRRRFTFTRVVAAAAILFAATVLLAAFTPTTRWTHGTGYAITANNAELYPLVPGHIASILITSGDRVDLGQPLIELNNDAQRAALDALDADDPQRKPLELERDQRTLRAPIAGIVHLHRFDVGEYVRPDQALGQVFDPSRWIVRIELTERTITHLKVGRPARVFLAAHHHLGSDPLPAVVARIDPVVTPRATGDGVYSVELSIDPPDDLLMEPGMTAWARVDTGQTTWLRRILGL